MAMDSLGANPQLTSEFVKFLNAQLQECRDQLQRLNEVRQQFLRDALHVVERDYTGSYLFGAPFGLSEATMFRPLTAFIRTVGPSEKKNNHKPIFQAAMWGGRGCTHLYPRTLS